MSDQNIPLSYFKKHPINLWDIVGCPVAHKSTTTMFSTGTPAGAAANKSIPPSDAFVSKDLFLFETFPSRFFVSAFQLAFQFAGFGAGRQHHSSNKCSDAWSSVCWGTRWKVALKRSYRLELMCSNRMSFQLLLSWFVVMQSQQHASIEFKKKSLPDHFFSPVPSEKEWDLKFGSLLHQQWL